MAEFAFPDVGSGSTGRSTGSTPSRAATTSPPLVIVEEDGSSTELSFDAIAARSDRVAAWLKERGVGKGRPVILMLGNQAELWDLMLAVMKLGAVIMPTTTAAGTSDLEDRITRGRATAVVTTPDQTWKFDGIAPDLTRISVGEADGWEDMHAAYAIDVPPTPHPGTAPGDPLLLYFTSGTTSRPKLVEHTQISLSRGTPVDDVLAGPAPRRRPPNISSPGWAKHAWSCFFAPWIAEATIFLYNYTRFDAASLLTELRDREVTSFCAPPTVWRMLINADPPAERAACARSSVPASHSTRGHRAGRRGVGLILRDGTARPR